MDKNKLFVKRTSIVITAVGIIFLAVTAILALNKAVWIDETFSLAIVDRSIPDIISTTAGDVHPPLYYLILKVFFELGNVIGANEIYVGKLVSVIPYILLLIIANTKMRKQFGLLCSSLFSVCILMFPRMLKYTVEIRMYSFAMLFVTLAFLFAFDIVKSAGKKGFVGFTIFSLCAAYTHYFACVGVAFIYLYLLIWFIRHEKNGIKKWLYCAIVTVIAYVPWLIVVVKQIMKVKADYWIDPVSLETIASCIGFPIAQSPTKFLIILGCILGLAYVTVIVLFIRNKKEDADVFAFTGLLVTEGVVVFGTVVSMLFRPVFFERYMFPTLGCFWFCFAYFVSRQAKNRKLFIPIILIMATVGIADIGQFVSSEKEQERNADSLLSLIDTRGDEDVFVYSNPHVEISMGYFYNNMNYALELDGNEVLGQKVFDNVGGKIDKTQIEELIKDGKTVWLFYEGDKGNVETDERLTGLSFEKQGTYNMAQYWFEVYKVNAN